MASGRRKEVRGSCHYQTSCNAEELLEDHRRGRGDVGKRGEERRGTAAVSRCEEKN